MPCQCPGSSLQCRDDDTNSVFGASACVNDGTCSYYLCCCGFLLAFNTIGANSATWQMILVVGFSIFTFVAKTFGVLFCFKLGRPFTNPVFRPLMSFIVELMGELYIMMVRCCICPSPRLASPRLAGSLSSLWTSHIPHVTVVRFSRTWMMSALSLLSWPGRCLSISFPTCGRFSPCAIGSKRDLGGACVRFQSVPNFLPSSPPQPVCSGPDHAHLGRSMHWVFAGTRMWKKRLVHMPPPFPDPSLTTPQPCHLSMPPPPRDQAQQRPPVALQAHLDNAVPA